MTPAKFERTQEKLELAYERGEIGKITFMREMSRLGFGVKTCREFFDAVASYDKLMSR